MKKYVKCDLCKSDSTTLLHTKDSFNIVKCNNCGLVYINPRLDSKILNQLYNKDNKDFDDQHFKTNINYYLNTKKDDEKTFEKRLKLIQKYKISGKLLDIGCSIGTFMDVARKKSWEVFGIDLSKASIDYCKKELKLNAKQGKLEDMKFPSGSFDVIIMSDLLEHVPSPVSTLEEASRILKKNGLLFITTPNIGSITAKLMGTRWIHLKPREHIYYFTPKTIEKALSKIGFQLIECKSLGRVRNLKTITDALKSFNIFLCKTAKLLIRDSFAKNISFTINPYDEMGVFAKKL